MDSFFAGCGYVGRQVALRELADGGAVAAIVRTAESAERLNREGIAALSADLENDCPRTGTLRGRVLYWFVPPQPEGDQDRRLRGFIQCAAESGERPSRVVLISTTGVYGDCQGEWVSEDRALAPRTGRARRRVDAEQVMRRWCQVHNIPMVALRVPGIYGAGKLPLKRLREGLPVLAPELAPWSNRVHVEDLISVCLAAARIEHPLPVYNVSDDHPSTMTDFFFSVADATGLPRPPVVDKQEATAALSAEMRSYLAESKRIDNTRMREHLGVDVRYPDLRSGLSALVGG
jgi:nucleoside-diphosphate-sugar epimerase